MNNTNPLIVYLWACGFAGLLIAAIQFGGDASNFLGPLGILILPGYVVAGVLTLGGPHSGFPRAFVTLMIIINAMIYGIPLMLLWRWRQRRKGRDRDA